MRRYFVFLVVVFFTIVACRKNRIARNYPIVPVDTYVNISLPQNSQLLSPGGWAYVSGGKGGLLIYRRSHQEFVAFDRNCTYNALNSCGNAVVDSSSVLIECSCDGSVYNLYDGSVVDGPAELPLLQYNTYFDGNFTVRVFN